MKIFPLFTLYLYKFACNLCNSLQIQARGVSYKYIHYLCLASMNSSEERLSPSQDSDAILLAATEEHNQSFGDLEDNAQLSQEKGHLIVLEEDAMEKNDILQPPKQVQLPEEESPEKKQKLCSKMMDKLSSVCQKEESSHSEQSYPQLDVFQVRHIQRVKVLYSRLLLGDRALSLVQLRQLKSIIYLPKYSQQLIQWGNKRYSKSLTILQAIQLVDYTQELVRSSIKPRCREDIRMLLILLLLLVLIKLLL